MRKLITITVGVVMAGAILVVAADQAKDAKAAPAAEKKTSIVVQLSGPGAVDATTIKANTPVSIDLYFATDKPRRAFTAGFKLSSPDIKSVIYPSDSGKGLNGRGNVKGHNGWQDQSVWDLKGLIIAATDWDGQLPDLLGLGGISVKQGMKPQPSTKNLSIELVVPTTGTLVLDSAFYPPGGYWKFEDGDKAAWGGPYTFKVVE